MEYEPNLNTTICIGSMILEVSEFCFCTDLNTTICIGSIRHSSHRIDFHPTFKYNNLYRFNAETDNGELTTFINLNTTICIGSIIYSFSPLPIVY